MPGSTPLSTQPLPLEPQLERIIPRAAPLTDHVILCGLGELGLRTIERLRAFGETVVVIEPNPLPAFERQLAEWNVTLVQESGRDPGALRRAGALTAAAVVAATDDDFTNLAIALCAREENPQVRLVVRLFNPRLVEKVQREIPRCRALDVAALAAPVFAHAGTHDDILHCVDLPGRRYLLREWRGQIPAGASVVAIRRMSDSTPLAIGSSPLDFTFATRPEWERLPTNTELGPEDVAVGLIRSDEAIPGQTPATNIRRARWNPGRWARDMRAQLEAVAQSPLAPVVGVLLVLGGVSSELFREALDLTWFQAIYFVVTILTTTGFGDISLRHADPHVMLYGTGLMLVGAMLMAVLYASLTDSLLSLRLASILGRAPLPQRDHFILCGFGTIGFRIAEELQALGHPTIAIERQENSRLIEQARRQGLPVLVRQDLYSAFNEVNIEEARCVMTVTEDDALNLELGLMAQEANPGLRVVMRLFDPHMASLVERTFGVHMARSPSAIAAPAFAVAASAEDLLDAFDVADTLWCVARMRLHADHYLTGLSLQDLPAKAILPLSLLRGESVRHTPDLGDETLQPGDELVIVTPHANWTALAP